MSKDYLDNNLPDGSQVPRHLPAAGGLVARKKFSPVRIPHPLVAWSFYFITLILLYDSMMKNDVSKL